ncbi:echinoderm microtubule-associated protein-like 2 isoform X2 [Arctopsyche grandis]|uniref:echinoderm microtubule-associated protein-like 2 isoform X2 n=2 Tax=Arctopsyche grandis TaxID=121162 RepID=UPI00406D6802
MMKLNGISEKSAGNNHTGRLHVHYKSDDMDEMLEAEGGGLAARVGALERRSLEQGEQLLCLRSSLADALRRLSQLETSRNGTHTPNTPTRSTTPSQSKDLRIKQPAYRSPDSTSHVNRDSSRRTTVHGMPNNSALTQRRGVHYQSTGSLQSESPNSSSSLSPAPSPSPRATPQPQLSAHRSRNNSTSSNQSNFGGGISPGSGNLTKRWSSTGDFNAPQGGIANNRFSTKSLLNLYSKPSQNGPTLKHGTHTCQYNDDDGTVRMFLRGRPIVLHAPSAVLDTYDLNKVAPPPHTKLKLDWVYGYRGKDCRSNLYLLPTGEMVYFVASVVVLFNVDEQCQRHYIGHTDDVKCLAIHPNKLVVATGQCAGHDRVDARPHIRIWNSVSLATLAVIGASEMERGVCCISFSRADGGTLLCAVDQGNEHNISVWDWQRGERGSKITETKCSVDTVVAAEFHPLDRNQIVTCGKNHIAFWTLDQGGTLYKRMGIFENRDKPKYVTCLAFSPDGDVISGDSNGNIIVWGRGTNTIIKFIRGVHEGSIFSICILKDGSALSGGGKDGRLIQLDGDLAPTGIECAIEGHFGGVRVLAEGRGSQVLVGTTKNCILQGDFSLTFSPVVLGHLDELWGLACHPNLAQFVTAGWDCLLQMWDALSHSTVWSKDIGDRAQSCAFSRDGSAVVVGCLTGKWMVFDSVTRELVAQNTDGAEPIQCIKFSPDGRLVAFGSRDNFIYIYQVDEDCRKYSRLGKCLGHSSYITHVDWSADGQYLRSNSGDYELLYWNPTTCRQITNTSSLRDVEWDSNTCTLSFQTIGIWPENADGTDINSCESSHDNRLVATGDDFGKVKLFSYPTTQPKSLCHQYGGHSSHVTSVSFLHDDTRLVSTGGMDTSVMQWSLE